MPPLVFDSAFPFILIFSLWGIFIVLLPVPAVGILAFTGCCHHFAMPVVVVPPTPFVVYFDACPLQIPFVLYLIHSTTIVPLHSAALP